MIIYLVFECAVQQPQRMEIAFEYGVKIVNVVASNMNIEHTFRCAIFLISWAIHEVIQGWIEYKLLFVFPENKNDQK